MNKLDLNAFIWNNFIWLMAIQNYELRVFLMKKLGSQTDMPREYFHRKKIFS
jgi:hypothetical protein